MSQTTKNTTVDRWEYQIVDGEFTPNSLAGSAGFELNQLGHEGWEAIGMVSVDDGYIRSRSHLRFYLKRKVQTD